MKSRYEFENGIYVIEEESVEVSFREKYRPATLPKSFSHRERVGEDHQVFIQLLQGGSRRIYLVKEGVWDGESIVLAPSEELLSRSYYKKGKLHGPSRCYFQNELSSETWYLEGVKNGLCRFFYKKEVPYAFLHYKQGLLHGECLFWYPNGTKKTVLCYKEGLLDGEGWLYYQNGSPKRHLHFLFGKLESQIIF